jgi:peptide deformylase
VTAEKEIIMNPEILRHTRHTVDSKEACTTFFDKGLTTVQRWNKMEVLYQIFGKDGKLETVVENVTGKRARVFQHEIQHMGLLGDKHYIYDI